MMHISYMYLLQRILKLAIFHAKIAPTDHGFRTPVPSPRMFWIQVPPWIEYQDWHTESHEGNVAEETHSRYSANALQQKFQLQYESCVVNLTQLRLHHISEL